MNNFIDLIPQLIFASILILIMLLIYLFFRKFDYRGSKGLSVDEGFEHLRKQMPPNKYKVFIWIFWGVIFVNIFIRIFKLF